MSGPPLRTALMGVFESGRILRTGWMRADEPGPNRIKDVSDAFRNGQDFASWIGRLVFMIDIVLPGIFEKAEYSSYVHAGR